MVLQPSIISFLFMVNGGVIRTAFGSNNKKNKIKPSFKHCLTNLAVRVEFFKIIANINPFPLTSEM